MVRVSFTANLGRHLAVPTAEAPAGPLRAVLDHVFTGRPAVRSYVLDDQDGLRKHVSVFIDGVQIADRRALSDPVPDGAEVWVMQALSGG
jgi:molybdopterin synthase sulfur carrier subunit